MPFPNGQHVSASLTGTSGASVESHSTSSPPTQRFWFPSWDCSISRLCSWSPQRKADVSLSLTPRLRSHILDDCASTMCHFLSPAPPIPTDSASSTLASAKPLKRSRIHFILLAVVMALFFKCTDHIISYPRSKTFMIPQCLQDNVKILKWDSQALFLTVLIWNYTSSSLIACKFQQPGIIIPLHTMYFHVSMSLFTIFPFAWKIPPFHGSYSKLLFILSGLT